MMTIAVERAPEAATASPLRQTFFSFSLPLPLPLAGTLIDSIPMHIEAVHLLTRSVSYSFCQFIHGVFSYE